jgi:starch synthase
VPIVARVGGLNDTIVDANEMALAAGVATGFQFAPVTAGSLQHAIGRAVGLWRDEAAWRKIQLNGMQADVGWDRPAARYAALYRGITRGPRTS